MTSSNPGDTPSVLIRDPLILVGAARSGTTMLFQALSSHPDLWSLYRESQPLLDLHFPVAMAPGRSALVTADDVSADQARAIQRAFFDTVGNVEHEGVRLAQRLPLIARAKLSSMLQKLGNASKSPPIRIVEKTPDNCFRIGMLQKVFSDARFIYVLRDPRRSIASVYHGWRTEARFRRYPLPPDFKLSDYTGSHWCFGLPPGWEELNGASLIEVCAFQWMSYNQACLRDLPNDPARVLRVRYEDLSARPGDVLEELARWCGLDPAPLRRYRERLPVVNTRSRPDDDKWRRIERELSTVLHSIEPLSRQLGYDLATSPAGTEA
ncbi:MAG: sulfotransferase family protein [Acidimicrobiales bacterium]